MGNNDEFYSVFYKRYITKVADVDGNFENIKRIAWLGWTTENAITRDISALCPNLETSDLYDIDTTKSENVVKWDINKNWNITGYDLVVCLRTSLFAQNAHHFCRQLRETTKNNKMIIMDFTLPEQGYFEDYPLERRTQLMQAFNLPTHIESFYSWYKPRWYLDPDQPGDLSGNYDPDHPETYRVDQANGGRIKPVMTKLIFDQLGPDGGYSLLPKFDSVYEHFFKKEVGKEYRKNSFGYVPSRPESVITEKMLFANDLMMKDVWFTYRLNHCSTNLYCTLSDPEKEEDVVVSSIYSLSREKLKEFGVDVDECWDTMSPPKPEKECTILCSFMDTAPLDTERE